MLTLKQRQIIDLLGQGLTNKEISKQAFISYRAVVDHISKMCERFGCKNRTHLVKYANDHLLNKTEG